jgi:hypothetical protein
MMGIGNTFSLGSNSVAPVYIVATYCPTYLPDLISLGYATKVKHDANLIEVHPQWKHNRLSMVCWLVHSGCKSVVEAPSLWDRMTPMGAPYIGNLL